MAKYYYSRNHEIGTNYMIPAEEHQPAPVKPTFKRTVAICPVCGRAFPADVVAQLHMDREHRSHQPSIVMERSFIG